MEDLHPLPLARVYLKASPVRYGRISHSIADAPVSFAYAMNGLATPDINASSSHWVQPFIEARSPGHQWTLSWTSAMHQMRERMEGSRCEKPFVGVVVVLFGSPTNQGHVTTSIGTNCLKEGVYSVEKGIASPTDAHVSQRSPEIGRKRTGKCPPSK